MLCQALDHMPGVSRTLASQLLRAGTSIGANVEEGQGSQSRADFIAKYSIACKEARETNYWLRLLAASEIMTDEKLKDLIDESNQLIAILTTIIKTTRKNS
jgi:four helix bundle protein